jgi:UDP-glucose 4-epimerase
MLLKSKRAKLPHKLVERRAGDVTEAYADTSKANTILGWTAQSTLEEALDSA